jgi:hypothetical protein
VDGQTLETFEAQLEQQLERLHRELREDTYQPLPVRQHRIPKQPSITNEPTSERSSTNSTAGSCAAFGRTVSAGGVPGVGCSCPG